MSQRVRTLDVVFVIVMLAAVALSVLQLLARPLYGRPVARAHATPARQPDASPQSSVLPPAERNFGPGEKLAYDVALKGVTGGHLQMSLDEEMRDGETKLVLRFEGVTAKGIGWIWSYQAKGTCYLNPETLLPDFTERLVTKGEKTKRMQVTFHRDESVAETVVEKLYKNKTKTRQVPFKQGLDLPSVLVYLRAVRLPEDKAVVLELLDEDKVYSVALTPGETKVLEVEAGRFEAQAMSVQVQLVTKGGSDVDEEEEGEGKWKSIRCWVAQERRLLVKLEIETSLGMICAELASVEPPVRKAGGE